jgi:hypothetical protein
VLAGWSLFAAAVIASAPAASAALRHHATTTTGLPARAAGLPAQGGPSISNATAASSGTPGYLIVAADGVIHNYNTAFYGDLDGIHLNQPIVASATTPGGQGYWMAASDGGMFNFGDARFLGSLGNIRLNAPIVGMAAMPNGQGFWLVAADGGVFEFGDAGFYGSLGSIRLNKPIVGIAATPDGRGYWLVASDGGIFEFGDAPFYGSTGNVRLNQPVVGMAADGFGGYWLVARDGGLFEFGSAPFLGSLGNIKLNQPVVGMAEADGDGYWMVAADGGIFEFGNAPFLGSTGGDPGPSPVVSMTSSAVGYPFPPGQSGYDVSQYQCSISLPSVHDFGIVQVSGGAIDNPPNPCYVQEADWAGANMSAYIFMNSLPTSGPTPSEALTGPAGTCNGNVICEGYNFGYNLAAYWVSYSHSKGVYPPFWSLDVETPPLGTADGMLPGARYIPSNDQILAGAVAGLRASGVVAGIYSTSYQWGLIAGSLAFPGIPLWIPGATTLSGPGYTAENYCASATIAPRFAGGYAMLVQYNYTSVIDEDYACPA